MAIAGDITEEVGGTPLVWLDSFADNLAGKVESFNPAGSVKDCTGAGFIPEVLRTELIDEVRPVDHERAVETTRRLASEEGILTGVSAGDALAAASDVARERPDDLVVVVLSDTGERYLSTDLFEAPAVEYWESTEPTPADD